MIHPLCEQYRQFRMTTHTPAWKRLGLQLKTSAAQNAYQEITPPSKKRKLSNADDQLPKLDTIVKGGPKKFAHVNVKSTNLNEPVLDVRSGAQDPPLKPKQERKSVSFDAGVEGNRAQGVHDAVASIPAGAQSAAANDRKGSVELVKNPSQKKKKRKEKPAAKELSPKSHSSDTDTLSRSLEKASKKSSPPYLRYLEQYANDRASWKFNKSHQIKLLDNIFNLNRVPDTYNAALMEYVKGLQGAGVRTRLKEDAERVVSEAPPASQDAAPTESNSDSTPANAPDTSSTAAFKAKQVSRAQSILTALAKTEPKPVIPPQTIQQADLNGVAKLQKPQQSKRSRGRVRRGDVPSADESSILSESSSDEANGD